MKHVISAMLIVVAIIHLLPVVGVLGGTRLTALYGLAFDEPNLVILMRHRAVLFAVLGVFLLVAAFRRSMQPAAFLAGFVSVGSFLALAWSVPHNPQLGRVVRADLAALICLVIGVLALAAQRDSSRV